MKCPFCAEEIKDETTKCPFCKEFLEKTSGNPKKSPAVPETITPEEYQKWLELAPKDVLKQTAKGLLICIDNTLDDPPHLEIFYTMLSMLDYEVRLREIEPLWRKAKRLTFRNSAIAKEITVRNLTAVKEFTVKNSDTIKEVGAIAACIGAGALVAGPAGALWALAVATSEEKETSQTPIFNARTAATDSNDTQSFYDKGLKELWQESYVASLTSFQKAIEKNPQDANIWFYLGIAYFKLGRHHHAIDAYEQAIRIKPDYAKAYLNLGRAYGNLGRWQEAVESYKQAIRIKPDYAEAHYNLGVAYAKLDRFEDAIDPFKQAIRIKPDYAEAHFGLGLTDLVVGDKSAAFEEYKILKTLGTEQANELFKFIYK